jgi:hypothetical protein
MSPTPPPKDFEDWRTVHARHLAELASQVNRLAFALSNELGHIKTVQEDLDKRIRALETRANLRIIK